MSGPTAAGSIPSPPAPPIGPPSVAAPGPAPRLVTDAEYAALRGELGFWQNLRLGVLGFDLALLGGVLASETLTTRSPFAVPALMTFVLFISALMIWHGARGSICIGTYLRVFYEEPSGLPGWEARLRHPITREAHHALGVFQYSRLLMAGLLMIFAASLFPVIRTFRTVEDWRQLMAPWGVAPTAMSGTGAGQDGGENAVKAPVAGDKPKEEGASNAAKSDPAEKGWTPERYDLLLAGAAVVLAVGFVGSLVAILRITSPAAHRRYLETWRKLRTNEQHQLIHGQFRLNGDRFELIPGVGNPNPAP